MMGRILGLVITAVLIVLAGIAAHSFGFLGVEQFLYIGQLISGWLAWTCLVAILYAGLEKLFPGVLCSASHEDLQPSVPQA